VPVHINGTADETTPLTDGASQAKTYDEVKNTWSQDLVTDGWDSAATITKGTVINIADVYMVNPRTKQSTGVLQDFVVLANVTANATTSNDTTLSISPPIIISGPHQTVTYSGSFDGKAITIKGDPSGTAPNGYPQNIVTHKNAMSLAVVPMEMPQGAVNGSGVGQGSEYPHHSGLRRRERREQVASGHALRPQARRPAPVHPPFWHPELRINQMPARQLSDGNSEGTTLGQDADDKVSFFGADPVDQPATIAGDATDATTASAQVNAVVAALKELGLIASS